MALVHGDISRSLRYDYDNSLLREVSCEVALILVRQLFKKCAKNPRSVDHVAYIDIL